MNRRQLIAGALSASLVLGALPGIVAAQEEEAVPYPAEGMPWQLATLAGEAVPEGVEVTLILDSGQATGSAGCNSYFGGYEIDATSLTFPQPFGVTQKLCEEPVQSVEDAYLPLLQSTAGWTIDEEGAFSLSDADGTVTLTYREQPVEITATDIEALAEELASLQAQIDQATADVAALSEAANSINVKKFDKRVSAVEEGVAKNEQKLGKVNFNKVEKRLTAAEKAIADNTAAVAAVDKAVAKLRDRVKAAEKTLADHEKRIKAIEEAVPIPEPV